MEDALQGNVMVWHCHGNMSDITKLKRRRGAMELSELIESIDIVEYISQYVELTEKNGEFWG